MLAAVASELENLIFLLVTRFFCNKPSAVLKGLCTSAQQVFFRYSSGFINILWKIADLINEKFLQNSVLCCFLRPLHFLSSCSKQTDSVDSSD